jgi:hypothetical protein
MWKTYKNDGVDSSMEFGDLLTRNLYARMPPFRFVSAEYISFIAHCFISQGFSSPFINAMQLRSEFSTMSLTA